MDSVPGFNRYIVECKGRFFIDSGATVLDLIDTLWNVKPIAITSPQIAMIDLIDTLWNVKAIPSTTSPYLRCDLIDTLWNVKVLQPVSHCQNSSI